jgi:hypothetical protein
MKVNVYLRTTAMPYIGEPLDSPLGLAITLGETEQEIDYDELVADLNLNALADSLKMPRGSLTIITPEEYAAEYGED